MDKKKFARLHMPISIELDRLGKEYHNISSKPIEKEEDIALMRNEFVRVANKFIDLKDKANSIPVPEGYDYEISKMREYFSSYIFSIKEVSEKFGIATSIELDQLKEEQRKASKLYHDYMIELTNKMFPR